MRVEGRSSCLRVFVVQVLPREARTGQTERACQEQVSKV
jgi:hypothetical protein